MLILYYNVHSIYTSYGLSKATAHAKVLNFVSNFSSLCYFMLFGEVYSTLGFVMIGGQIIGSYIGAHMVIKKGAVLIKPVVILICFAMAVRMIFSA